MNDMLNAQKAKLIIAACLSFFVGTFLALYTKNLPTFGAGVLVAAYFLVEFLTMLKNSKADKYIKVTALAVNADESRAGLEPMETWRFIPVNEDGEQLHAAIAALPDKQAKRIYAYYFLGLTESAIAKSEGVSVASVSESIQRGLRNMETFLKNRL